MTAPVIRDEVLAAWARYLVRHGFSAGVADAMALELEQIAVGRGARLPRHPRPEDPNAISLALIRAPATEPGDATAGAEAARAALAANRARRPPPDDRPEPLPPHPDLAEGTE